MFGSQILVIAAPGPSLKLIMHSAGGPRWVLCFYILCTALSSASPIFEQTSTQTFAASSASSASSSHLALTPTCPGVRPMSLLLRATCPNMCVRELVVVQEQQVASEENQDCDAACASLKSGPAKQCTVAALQHLDTVTVIWQL